MLGERPLARTGGWLVPVVEACGWRCARRKGWGESLAKVWREKDRVEEGSAPVEGRGAAIVPIVVSAGCMGGFEEREDGAWCWRWWRNVPQPCRWMKFQCFLRHGNNCGTEIAVGLR